MGWGGGGEEAFGKEDWEQSCERGLAIPAKAFEFYVICRRSEKIPELIVLFRKIPQLVVWRRAWGRENMEEGIQTDSMLSNRMAMVASSAPS